MLWYKGWLETRLRLCMALGCSGLIVFLLHSHGTKAAVLGILRYSTLTVLVMICAFLAGAGVATQPTFQATRGLHGSTLFTLSLPVSRLRLLAIRAGVGWLEMTGVIATLCWGMWLASPLLRTTATAAEMVEYAGTLVVCISAIYFLSVLLAAFFDDLWRIWGTLIVFFSLSWLSHQVTLPPFVDVFRAMGKGSPLIAHTMPWTAMAFSIALSAVLFFAALKVVRTREY